MRGFTLIELLVAITIIGILVVLIVPNYNSYNNNQRLNDEASKLQTILRQAQNNAQTGTVCQTGGGPRKATYWHVSLSKVNNGIDNKIYSFYPVCESGYQSSQTTTLPSGVTISDFKFNYCNPSSIIKVQFSNISSEVAFIDPGGGCLDATNASLEITLSLAGSSNTKKVVVEKGGGIYVQQ